MFHNVSLQANTIFNNNAGGELSLDDWRRIGNLSTNIGRDLAVAESFLKILRDIRSLTNNIPSSFPSPGAASFDVNNATNSSDPTLTLVSRVSSLVCGRNISGNPFSSGGQAMRFDNLRDQIKEKDDYNYQYDNTTSEVIMCKTCNFEE